MPSKPKSARRTQTGSKEFKQHIAALKKHEAALRKNAAALDKHTAALNAHTGAMEKAGRAQAALIDAVSTTRRAFAALAKSYDDKATDARDCMRTWLVKNKRVSSTDAGDPGKNMANDFLMNIADMGTCLKWVQGCLLRKHDIFTPDESYDNLSSLVNGTLGAVIAYIADNIKP